MGWKYSNVSPSEIFTPDCRIALPLFCCGSSPEVTAMLGNITTPIARSKFNAYKGLGNSCPVCASTSGKCRWQNYKLSAKNGKITPTIKTLCMTGAGGYGNPDYHYFNDTRDGQLGIYTAVCGFMGYSYLQKPHSERGREFKVSSICLRTAVSPSSIGMSIAAYIVRRPQQKERSGSKTNNSSNKHYSPLKINVELNHYQPWSETLQHGQF